MMIGQSSGGADAASGNAQNRKKNMKVSQWERKAMEGSWVQMDDKRNFEKKKKKSTCEVQKASKTVRSTLLNGSVWRTERKYLKRNKKVPSTRAQNEERRDGGAVQQRGQARLEACS